MKHFYTAALLALASCAPAYATQCTTSEQAHSVLKERHGETRIGAGLSSDDHIVEIWTNPETQTWTILVTTAHGISCLGLSGENWIEYFDEYGDPA